MKKTGKNMSYRQRNDADIQIRHHFTTARQPAVVAFGVFFRTSCMAKAHLGKFLLRMLSSAVNQPVSPEVFDHFYEKVMDYFKGKDVFVRDLQVCAP